MCQPPRPQQPRQASGQQRHLTIGQAARQLGVPDWKVRRTFDQIAPGAPRLGDDRIVTPGLMPKLVDELYRDGYLRERPGG